MVDNTNTMSNLRTHKKKRKKGKCMVGVTSKYNKTHFNTGSISQRAILHYINVPGISSGPSCSRAPDSDTSLA